MGVKISALTLKSTPDGTEQIEVNDGGTTKKVTTAGIATLVTSLTGIVTLWDFSAHAGNYPTDPDKLYIVTDSSVLPENTWMVAITSTPSGSGDFFTK